MYIYSVYTRVWMFSFPKVSFSSSKEITRLSSAERDPKIENLCTQFRGEVCASAFTHTHTHRICTYIHFVFMICM